MPVLGEEDEQAFIKALLGELNDMFALQLDSSLHKDRSCQAATNAAATVSINIVPSRASRSLRLIDHLECTFPAQASESRSVQSPTWLQT